MVMDLIYQYIFEQPETVDAVIKTVGSQDYSVLKEHLADSRFSAVYLVGSGSSLNAAHAARSYWQAVSHRLEILDPLNFLVETEKGAVGQGAVVIGISQSGASKLTVDALKKAKEVGAFTVAVTANGDGHLAGVADLVCVVPIGEELVGPKTKGYSASVAYLAALSLVLQGREVIGKSKAKIEAYLPQAHLLQELAKSNTSINLFYVVGSGDNLGTAREGALKIIEIARLPALHFDIEDSMHGPFACLDENSFVIVLGGDPIMGERIDGLLKMLDKFQAKGVLVSNGKIYPFQDGDFDLTPQELDPVADVVPVQILAHAFAGSIGKVRIISDEDRTFLRGITKLLN